MKNFKGSTQLIVLIVVIILIICATVVFLLTSKNNTFNSNDESINETESGENQPYDVENSENNESIIETNNSFEERTKVYFEQLQDNSGDRTKLEYANVRLNKKDDNNYELVADIKGMKRFSKEEIQNWIKEIEDNELDKLEIPILNNDKVMIVYSLKPDFVKLNYGYDDDWKKAQDGEWLDEDGIPMFLDWRETSNVGLENDDNHSYDNPVFLRQEDDGYYYPRYRHGANVINDYFAVITLNAKDVISIILYPDDIIHIEHYGDFLDPIEMTVKEYYDASPSVVDNDISIDANDMSVFGFGIKDNAIYVTGCYNGI